MTSKLKSNGNLKKNVVTLKMMMISKMLFLELWRATESCFRSIQMKELGNNHERQDTKRLGRA